GFAGDSAQPRRSASHPFLGGPSRDRRKLPVKIFQIIIGLLLVAAALHDMFHTLFHPSGRGAIAEFISFHLWRGWRRVFPARHETLSLAGPVAFLLTVITWGLAI